MGRTVVVRSSYDIEVKKLNWVEKSISKDSRIPDTLKTIAKTRIAALRETLTELQTEIDHA